MSGSPRHFIRAGAYATLPAFLARYPGVSVPQLVRSAGLDPQQLANRDALVSSRAFIALLEGAARETGDACFALELAAQVPWSDLGVLGYLMLHSPTLRAGAENACRYLAVQQTAGRATFTADTRTARLTYAVRDDVGACRQHVESVLYTFVRYCRLARGDARWGPREVRLRHAAPARADVARVQRHFCALVRFGARDNAVVLARADLDTPAQSADAGLFPILQRYADEVLARMPAADDLPGEVRQTIAQLVAAGDASVEAVARKLATSARTLQRRLRDEHGVSFVDLVSETRLGLARRYLQDDSLSITDAALLVGYSDLSAFSRACRRWTGKSPNALRESR